MSGQMRNYNKYYKVIKNMDGPVMPSQLPRVKIDSNGLVNYARERGKKVTELSEGEKSRFIKEL